MVRPRGSFGSYGPAMLPVVGDAGSAASAASAAPALLGVLLVFGFLGDLVAAAGVPVTTPLSVHAGGTSNHKGNRQTHDGSLRRSYADLHPAHAGETQETIRLRGSAEFLKPMGSNPDCRFPTCDPSSSAREAKSSPISSGVLGVRMRPIGGHKQVQLMPRKTKDKKDEDDDDDDYDDEDDGKEAKHGPGKTFKIKKHKLKKWLLPLLVGYKLKFMTLVPLLFATLALLVASAGFAGFFFAMFTAALTLPKGHH